LQIRVQRGFFTSTIGLAILAIFFGIFIIVGGIFTYAYTKYARMIDARLSGNILQNTTQIFSAPEHISTAEAWGPDDLTDYLTRVGYRPEADPNALGQYTVQTTRWTFGPRNFLILAARTRWRCNSGERAFAASVRSRAGRKWMPRKSSRN